MPTDLLFHPYEFGADERAGLDRDGHLALPGLLTETAAARLTESLARIPHDPTPEAKRIREFAAEHDPYLAGLIAHPDLLALARAVLGPEIRFDHCVVLNRPAGDRGLHWHSHAYAEDRPELGFLRIFLYVNGFEPDDGGLKVVPGSHLFRDPAIHADGDAPLREGWLRDRRHPATGAPLEIEALSAAPGTVLLMWTHAAHAVTARRPGSPPRHAVVYAYRNPGAASRSRWISERFERQPPPGAEDLLPAG